MNEVHKVSIPQEEGKIIELPKTVGRVDTFYDHRPVNGVNFEMTVVGRGDCEKHVLRKASGENVSVEECAQILATDVNTAELWYAVPLSQYGGN
ncbi:hypothetical protein [Haloarcula sp. H-GB5]